MDLPQRLRDSEIARLNSITSQVIGAAIEVHRVLGPGLLEPMYEQALCIELDERHMRYKRQPRADAFYKGRLLGTYRIDLIIEAAVLVEIKCVTAVLPVFEAQLLTYMRAPGVRIGLLINFNASLLKHGITRRIL
jgi:GxxExxY protein